MTDRVPRWALRDALRVIRRAQHSIYTGRDLGAEETAYLRGQVTLLLLGPFELPGWIPGCLRDLLGALEGLAAELDEEEA